MCEAQNYMPKQLEMMLENLCQDKTLTSWTIQGNSKTCSVIIRFNMEADMDVTKSFTSKFKRIPPSQMNRDRRRIQERTQQGELGCSDPPSVPPQGQADIHDAVSTKAHGHDTTVTTTTSSNPSTPLMTTQFSDHDHNPEAALEMQ